MGHHACSRKCAPVLEWPPIRVRVSLHLKWVRLQPRDTLVPEKPGPWICSLPSLCIFILVLAWWIFIFSVAEKESNRETTKPFFPRPNPPIPCLILPCFQGGPAPLPHPRENTSQGRGFPDLSPFALWGYEPLAPESQQEWKDVSVITAVSISWISNLYSFYNDPHPGHPGWNITSLWKCFIYSNITKYIVLQRKQQATYQSE